MQFNDQSRVINTILGIVENIIKNKSVLKFKIYIYQDVLPPSMDIIEPFKYEDAELSK